MNQTGRNANQPQKSQYDKENEKNLRILREYCEIKKFIHCEKLNASGVGWNRRVLRVTSEFIEYFNYGKKADEIILKGRIPISAIIHIPNPENPSKGSSNKSLQISFLKSQLKEFKNGLEAPKRFMQPEDDIGHKLWMFKFNKQRGDPFSVNMNELRAQHAVVAESVQSHQDRSPIHDSPQLAFQNNQDNNQQMEDIFVQQTPQMMRNDIPSLGFSQFNQRNQSNYLGISKQKRYDESSSVEKKKERFRLKWDYRYSKFWEEYYRDALREEKTDKEWEIEQALILYAFLGEFRQFSVESVKRIIHELIFPVRCRRYREVKKDHPMYQFKQKNELAYLVDGIFIRVAYVHINRSGNHSNLQKLSKREQLKPAAKESIFNFEDPKRIVDVSSGSEYYQNLTGKLIAHEFRTNNVIADSVHQLLLSSNNEFTIRVQNQKIIHTSDKCIFFFHKVPLTCQVDYLGFTCLCSSVSPLLLVKIPFIFFSKQIPCLNLSNFYPQPPKKRRDMDGVDLSDLLKQESDANSLSLVNGMRRNGMFIETTSDELRGDLEILGDYMRLKSFSINGTSNSSQQQIEIFLSLFSEVHCIKNRDLILNEIKHEVEGETIKAKMKRIRILNSKQKKSDKSDIQDHKKFYLFKTATIFPLEIDVEQAKHNVCLFKNRLRPEFICMINTYLSNGAFINQNMMINTDQDDLLLASAGLKLKNEAINKLVHDLESMTIQPIGSEQLSQYFHMYGVNMRHLGKVVKRLDLPYIKEICMTDMIARSSKKILRANLAEFILYRYNSSDYDESAPLFRRLRDTFDQKAQNGYEESFEKDILIVEEGVEEKQYYEQLDEMEQQYDSEDNRIYEEKKFFEIEFDNDTEVIKKEIDRNFCRLLNSIFVDYLNLVFGSDEECNSFWKNILIPQIESDFQFQLPGKPIHSISQGQLLHAISYHWRIDFKQEDYIKIFTPYPFEEIKDSLKVVPHSKVYSFKSLSARKTIEEYPESIDAQQYDLALNYMAIKRCKPFYD